MEEAKQDINDISEKKSFVAWAKMHKKQLIIAGISIPSLAVTIFGVKRKDSIKEFWNSLKDEIGNAKLYSNKWFMKATDAELDVEREKVRLAYCSSKDNYVKYAGFKICYGDLIRKCIKEHGG